MCVYSANKKTRTPLNKQLLVKRPPKLLWGLSTSNCLLRGVLSLPWQAISRLGGLSTSKCLLRGVLSLAWQAASQKKCLVWGPLNKQMLVERGPQPGLAGRAVWAGSVLSSGPQNNVILGGPVNKQQFAWSVASNLDTVTSHPRQWGHHFFSTSLESREDPKKPGVLTLLWKRTEIP